MAATTGSQATCLFEPRHVLFRSLQSLQNLFATGTPHKCVQATMSVCPLAHRTASPSSTWIGIRTVPGFLGKRRASGPSAPSGFWPGQCECFLSGWLHYLLHEVTIMSELVLASSAPLFSFIILDMKSLQLCFWLPESESKCQKSTLATAEGGEIHVWIKVWHFMFVAGLLNASKLISDVSSVQTPCSPAHQSSLSRILSCCGNVCRHELSVV